MNLTRTLTITAAAGALVLASACQRTDDPATDGPTGAGNPTTTTTPPMGTGTTPGSASDNMGGNPGTSGQGMPAEPPASAASR
jgi:hypothetical protein